MMVALDLRGAAPVGGNAAAVGDGLGGENTTSIRDLREEKWREAGGAEQVSDGLGILDLQGHGIIVAWASPARRHGARTPSSTVEEREGKENLRKTPCPLLNKLQNGPAATLAI